MLCSKMELGKGRVISTGSNKSRILCQASKYDVGGAAERLMCHFDRRLGSLKVELGSEARLNDVQSSIPPGY